MLLRFVLVVVIALAGRAAMAESATKCEGTPDFCQTDKDGLFYNGGRTFCGPVAASNALMWFAQNGSPALVDGKRPGKETQIEMIRTLASSDYMGTEDNDGTGVQRFMEGAAKYVAERGQRLARLEYRGWRPMDKKLKPTDRRPTLEWIAETTANPRGGTCINVGWYTHAAATDTYTRRAGHWMTVTGAEANDDRPTIDLHDPASRSGNGKVTHRARLQRLAAGTLTGDRKGLPTKADALFEIRDGIVPKQVVKGEKTHPIIDGVVVMVLK